MRAWAFESRSPAVAPPFRDPRGFRVYFLGFRVYFLGFRVYFLGFRDPRGFRVYSLGFRDPGECYRDL